MATDLSRPTSGHLTVRPSTLAGPDAAYFLLRTVFTIAPIASGSTSSPTCSPTGRLPRPWINDIVPGNGDQAMYVVGVIEVVAGLVVAWKPRFGGLLVAAWLAGIILDLVTLGDYYDVALRDFGLLVGALALSALAAGRRSSGA